MSLDEARAQINTIDARLRELLVQRLECSEAVAAAKHETGEVQVCRPEREAAILDDLAANVPAKIVDECIAVQRKIIQASRMHQYRLLLEWDPTLFETVPGSALAVRHSEHVRVLVGIRDEAGALANALAVIADAGCNIADLNSIEAASDPIRFELVICGDILDPAMRAALLQLSCETRGFRIVSIA